MGQVKFPFRCHLYVELHALNTITCSFQGGDLLRIARSELYAIAVENLLQCANVGIEGAGVWFMPKRFKCLGGREALRLLQGDRSHLIDDSGASSFLPSVDQNAAILTDKLEGGVHLCAAVAVDSMKRLTENARGLKPNDRHLGDCRTGSD